VKAYEKLGRYIIRAVASIPLITVGILFKIGFLDKTCPPELLWILAILIILCFSSGVQGVFLCFVAEERKEQKEPRPTSTSSELDPVFYMCGHTIVKNSQLRDNTQYITVGCKLKQMNRYGCPEKCPYYYVPKGSGGGVIGGALLGALIGAFAVGVPGAVIGGLIGTVLGSSIEDQVVKSSLYKEIERVKQEGRNYRILICA